jgi:hypothetical protein
MQFEGVRLREVRLKTTMSGFFLHKYFFFVFKYILLHFSLVSVCYLHDIDLHFHQQCFTRNVTFLCLRSIE